jgi:fatty acid amide hydrolase 2
MPRITERSATDLASGIRQGELTSAAVVEAHIEQTARLAPSINAVVADRFELARAEARAADDRAAAARSARGVAALPPLLGVPFTVKETIELAGMPNAAGLVARRAYRAQQSAPAAQRLIDAGAIPIGVTNTSELTLWIESENRLYGRTNNPYDVRRTAGGSSGGEGAAIGAGCAPFGIGSDIAGSIRIPALFCGVFGHKPSAGLVPNTGMFPPSTGTSGTMLGTGPLARRAEDLMPILRVIAGPDGVDPMAAQMTLGDPAAVSLQGLTVTTVEESSRRPMAPELRDAREQAVGALIAAGASVRRVRLRTWRGAVLPYLATLQDASGAGAQTTIALLLDAGEAKPSWRTLMRRRGAHTAPTRVALAAELLPEAGEGPARDRLLANGRDLAAELIDAIGDGVLLHPAHPRAAPRHGRTIGRPWLMTPAAVFNLAGVPVTEVPLGLGPRGLPVGVQVAARHGADHLTVAVALELERVFGGWVPPRLARAGT